MYSLRRSMAPRSRQWQSRWAIRVRVMTDGCASARWRISTSSVPLPACCFRLDGSGRSPSILLSCDLVASDWRWWLPLLSDTASATAFALIEVVGELSVWFALVSILPLPPLTGAHLLAAAAPAYGKVIAKISPYSGIALALVAATGVFTNVLGPGYRILANSLLH